MSLNSFFGVAVFFLLCIDYCLYFCACSPTFLYVLLYVLNKESKYAMTLSDL